MAIHMALGLVFLGGGELTLGRSNEAIAALVVSLFPRFPSHSQDNQYHLQPLRHLYVLAAEPRSFLAFDVDSGLPVFVPIEITTAVDDDDEDLGSGFESKQIGAGASSANPAAVAAVAKRERRRQRLETRELVAPCLLTNDLASVVRLRVLSPRYHALCLLPRRYASHAVALAGFKILVKRKAGHLSHAADPHGLRSVHSKKAQPLVRRGAWRLGEALDHA